MSKIEKSSLKNAPLTLPEDANDFVSWATSVPDGSISAGWQPMHPHLADNLPLNFTRERAEQRANGEPDSGMTSGSAQQKSKKNVSTAATSADPRRQSLAKLVEFSRRRMRLTVEQLADKANIELAELLAIERAESVPPESQALYQLARVLQMPVEPLLELGGLSGSRSGRLIESAAKFAARFKPTEALRKEEEEALNWFVQELSK